MKILVIGGGGREHAIAWKIKQSKKVIKLYITPGNGGTSLVGTNLGISNSKEIVNWLKKNKMDLVVVGPDSYLASGIVDKISKLGIPVFGPTKKASEIEWSKSFAKRLMKNEGIPTATSKTFSNFEKAKKYLNTQKFPIVIKADGLAFGKGVVIAKNIIEAKNTLKNTLLNKKFGLAGRKILIEEYLEGREISIHAFCDGNTSVLFPSSQDHKRIFDGDIGPNTGGMGVISPVPNIDQGLLNEIKNKIVDPCLFGLKRIGKPFVGVLYPGIIITKDGPKVIEFNARFGDPEAQVYMRTLETELIGILVACTRQKLNKVNIKWSKKSACCVVLVSKGYPNKYKINKEVSGIEKIKDKNVVVFHAGTNKVDNDFVTSGGRVFGVTYVSKKLDESIKKAYKNLKHINFEGMQYRTDIGRRKQ